MLACKHKSVGANSFAKGPVHPQLMYRLNAAFPNEVERHPGLSHRLIMNLKPYTSLAPTGTHSNLKIT